MPRVTLYSRPGCHLCDHAKRAMAAAMPAAEVKEVDVDSEPGLRERYGDHVPVAVADGRELFRHRFDPDCVRVLLAG